VFRLSEPIEIDYCFPLGIVADNPVLGRRGLEMLIGMIALARSRGSLHGQFRAKTMAQFLRLNPPESGRLYSDIRRTFLCLASVELRLASGSCYRFLDSWRLDGRTYHFTLSRETLGITALWIEGRLRKEDIGSGYIYYPLAFLQASICETEKGFRDYMLMLPMRTELRIVTLARRGCGFSVDDLKRRLELRLRIYAYLENAVSRGDLEFWKADGVHLRTWRKTWKVTLIKPRPQRRSSLIFCRELTAEELRLADEIHEWMRRPVLGLRADAAEMRSWIENAIRRHGVIAVRRAYEAWGRSACSSVHRFWQQVKEAPETDTLSHFDDQENALN
jgi:hypothetical protein